MNTIEIKRGRKPFVLPSNTQVDWSRTNREIGAQFGISPMSVLLLRRREGIEPLPRGRPVETKHKPETKSLETQVGAMVKPIVNQALQNALNNVYAEIRKQLNIK